MRILLCHNFYQQAGGEDRVFADEAELLRTNGHDVEQYTVHNDAIDEMNNLSVAAKTFYNRDSARKLRKRIREFQPDLLHCTNTFPLISPAAYWAARRENVPVVQALHNFRLLCPGAVLAREGRVCEECLTRSIKWPAVRHACYRNSRAGSLALASMLAVHRWLGTWARRVDRYYTLTQFGRQKFIEAGFPAERIGVKPNFVAHDPGAGSGDGGYAVFVGRLSSEKGIDVMLDAWREMDAPPVLKIIGNGPLQPQVVAAANSSQAIEYLGWRDHGDALQVIGRATCLILPSVNYEGFPKVLVEAFSLGTPVIASRLGSMEELIEDGVTGRLATAGDPQAFSKQIRSLFAAPDELPALRKAARAEYLEKYSANANHDHLMDIYEEAQRTAGKSSVVHEADTTGRVPIRRTQEMRPT